MVFKQWLGPLPGATRFSGLSPLYTGGMKSESVSHSVLSDSVSTCTVASKAPLSMEFSRQEYWSGPPFPPPGDLPNPEMEPTFSALAGGFFTHRATGEVSSQNKYFYVCFNLEA